MESLPRINADRLWQSLMEMARIGATTAGGCNRQALTPEDGRGRDLFARWCEQAGCTLRVDEIGNIFARRAGLDDSAPPLLVGSHLDTQPTGGRFDGVYGVLAGLEVIRTLNDLDLATQAPVEVAVWTNEEGARFTPALLGSGVWAGVFALEDAYRTRDKQGQTVEQALDAIGYRGGEKAQHYPVTAALEVHIEQGPILEKEGLQVGVVEGVQGIRWYQLTISGDSCHAGPTPMAMRRDAVRGLTRMTASLYAMADRYGEHARVTFGDIRVSPGTTNTVPASLVLAIDLRHPEEAELAAMDAELREMVTAVSAETDLDLSLQCSWHSPAVRFDTACVAAVQSAVDRLQIPARRMVSGAGHDSVYIARVAPTAMIFVPCEGGISHNEAENAEPGDLAAGADVLLHAVLQLAGRPASAQPDCAA